MFITRQSPGSAYIQIQNLMSNTKFHCQQLRAGSSAGNITIEEIDRFVNFLISMKAQAGAISTTQGLVDYANAQHPDVPTYDVVTEYNAVMSEIDNALAWIAANIPADGSGYELVYQRNPDGSKVYREFTPAQTTGLRTTLSAIEALIE